MPVERHLILQSVVLRPSGEWTPPVHAWVVLRVAEGVGYWLQGGSARELKTGDGFVAAAGSKPIVRASQLGVLKLEYYLVQPQLLNGLLTVTEGNQLENAAKNDSGKAVFFVADEPLGQKFSRLSHQSQPGSLPSRSSLVQLWAQAVNGLLVKPTWPAEGLKLRERFRQMVSQMPDAELATRSLSELAAQLHCSERHFSRLFREELGIPLRARRTELRLLRASRLLAESDEKIILVAFESGYRHLGLFNSMFKKRFGMTPSKWRQKNSPKPLAAQPRNFFKRTRAGLVLLLLLQTFLTRTGFAQTTNAGPKFTVEKYLVAGNSVLPPNAIGEAFTNASGAFGTNVTFTDVRAALGDLQMAYRERGFVTVSVGLPPQKLTNGTVRVKVTEGRLAKIDIKGNDYFSTLNVLRALPSLRTNMLLNSHVFQRELDLANANRNRQIYPVIGPGPEPGTSELTLKVKDRLPLHARVEINNQATPGTPDSRVAFSAQYDNLWQLEHQIGVQYSFAPFNYRPRGTYYFSPLDLPLLANYSAYYRMPFGDAASVQREIDQSGGHYGFNQVTHQFQMPPPTGRPELTVYASRSPSDTGVQLTPAKNVITTPLLKIDSFDSGENLTLNEGVGGKFTLPLPVIDRLATSLQIGADYKHYQLASFNSNNFTSSFTYTNGLAGRTTIVTTVTSPQPIHQATLDYFPINLGLNGSRPDAWGSTAFNVQANFNVATVGHARDVAYSTNAPDNYFTVQAGASREQRLYRDWTMLVRADGQWAATPLFSNEQFGMGGVGGVRGYSDGENFGDTGWRVMVEPRTPLVNIGMVDGDVPFWVRASVFMDYGETYLLQKIPAPGSDAEKFWGWGWSLTANIGSHLDGRLTMAFPLIASAITPAWDVHVYFGVGAQF
jgi:hemolysin activation/secretion protein